MGVVIKKEYMMQEPFISQHKINLNTVEETLEISEDQALLNEVKPDSQAQLELLCFQLSALTSQLKEERLGLEQERQEMVKLIDQFKANLKTQSLLGDKIRAEIDSQIHTASQRAIKEIGEVVGERTTHAIDKIVSQLEQSTHRASVLLDSYHGFFRKESLIVSAAIFFGSILTAVAISWFLMPQQIDRSMANTYRNGQYLESFWDKLNEKQQQWLTDLSNNKIKNNGGHHLGTKKDNQVK
jgi:hypothetical protein